MPYCHAISETGAMRSSPLLQAAGQPLLLVFLKSSRPESPWALVVYFSSQGLRLDEIIELAE